MKNISILISSALAAYFLFMPFIGTTGYIQKKGLNLYVSIMASWSYSHDFYSPFTPSPPDYYSIYFRHSEESEGVGWGLRGGSVGSSPPNPQPTPSQPSGNPLWSISGWWRKKGVETARLEEAGLISFKHISFIINNFMYLTGSNLHVESGKSVSQDILRPKNAILDEFELRCKKSVLHVK